MSVLLLSRPHSSSPSPTRTNEPSPSTPTLDSNPQRLHSTPPDSLFSSYSVGTTTFYHSPPPPLPLPLPSLHSLLLSTLLLLHYTATTTVPAILHNSAQGQPLPTTTLCLDAGGSSQRHCVRPESIESLPLSLSLSPSLPLPLPLSLSIVSSHLSNEILRRALNSNALNHVVACFARHDNHRRPSIISTRRRRGHCIFVQLCALYIP
jgi:hypothetical protein